MPRHDRFLNACRGLPVDATPIWLMRQAGRYMAEYRALRENYGILEMIKTPELAAEVTLQPVRAFEIDAAIIFADILPALEELGFELTFVSGRGPVIGNPIRSADQVGALRPTPGCGGLDRTCEAIRQVRAELDGLIPLIGFCGAPFTLACYAIEGGGSKDFLAAKQFMYEQPAAWAGLLDALTDVLGDYLAGQVEAGAQTIQIFDSWAGALSPADYREYALPWTRRLVNQVRERGVPVIHFGTGLSGFLPIQKELGADVLGIDWRISLADARRILGPEVAVQGNLDPAVMLAPVDVIRGQASRVLAENGGAPGHIFNLGHGIFKTTPVDHVRALVDHVHGASAT
jgi:uroporphyrinogen decarboxylase